MNNPVYLITGPSGSGKTAVADELSAKGFAVIEADSTQGLCFFVNKAGKPVPYPQGADAHWWETHNYIWELNRLSKFIEQQKINTSGPVFVCGNAGNISKAASTFTQIFYLDIPENIMLERIKSGIQDHNFGQRIDEPEQLVRWAAPFKEEMLGLGAVVIDATKPLNTVVGDIVKLVKVTA